ncbi:MAG: DUF3179 domain-containing protein [Haloarculaceae archaeon]
MQRRRVLRISGLLGAGLAGCVSPPGSTAGGGGCPGAAPAPGSAASAPTPAAGADVDLPLPREELARGALRDEIPAITDPAFGPDWRAVEDSLADDDLVIGVARGGQARAYPLATLIGHEVVNDHFDGPLLVTYCPLCASAVTAVREVGGEPTVFGVSGLLFRSNLVLYDRRTGSLWSQLLARAVRGPETGTGLELVPSTLTSWAAWRADYPDSTVMLPPPASDPIETVPEGMPAGVHGHVGVGTVELDVEDDRLPRTSLVLGVATEDHATAYPRDSVAAAGVVNDCVGGLPVVVAGQQLPHAFDRRVDGDPLRFERAGANRLRAGGSTWALPSGRAVDGPHEGTALRQVTGAVTMYWFAWVNGHPETAVYGQVK